MAARFKVGDRLKDQMVARLARRSEWAYEYLVGEGADRYVNPYIYAVVDEGQGSAPAIYDVIIPYSTADDALEGWLIRVSEDEFR